MKVSACFIVVLLILSCSSSMIMGFNNGEDHCYDWSDCAVYCKRYVPQPNCINHHCDCRPPVSTDDDLHASATSSNFNKN
ncbi:unnamed protein product [Arabis nemorensis]|uniref:Knottin scorpion toxin-like domain-containing protein n=1 Tax=Arabis nemorensis TaxID=586526 RepID=A0A565C3N2_9BRAS|nr:unnamed protein product [Arabis nemorensis]